MIEQLLEKIHWQLENPEPISSRGIPHTASSNRTITTTRSRLDKKGTLVSAIVIETTTVLTQPGQCYVRLRLEDEERRIIAELCQGYVSPGSNPFGTGAIPITGGERLRLDSYGSQASVSLTPIYKILPNVTRSGGWRGTDKKSTEGSGWLRSVTGANPAALGGLVGGGNDASDAVPTNARWKLLGYHIQLVTSSQTGAREVHFRITDGTNILFESDAASTQAASLTRDYTVASGAGTRGNDNGFMNIEGPAHIILAAAFTVATSTTTIKTLDDYGAPNIWVEEWIDV